ncbi:CAP domain-containing protein [Weissella cibaria]|uniref:CAP domain-containing protein n=1 Tax=Weissella cibaria TaxID=137591 RepID=UPI00113182CC|nr:CAP domain-containing protein [Weissella cibaria]QDG80694.1 LysM peptidoglycan-binding domain-containing protein [Weissella cibaria]
MEKVSVNKSIKGMALTTAAVAAAVLPFMHTNAASADDSAKGWRSKTVDEVRTTVKDAGRVYVVQSGDTLSTIAAATDRSVDDIAKQNDITNANMIEVGQKLDLVSEAPATSVAASVAPSEASLAPAASSVAPASSVASQASSASSEAPVATSAATSTAPVATVSPASADATLNALNALRASAGLPQLVWDDGLAASATARAASMSQTGADQAHYSGAVANEVVAAGFGAGQDVISAWFNETNMTGVPNGHHDWEMNGSFTRVGFGYVNGWIVGHAE